MKRITKVKETAKKIWIIFDPEDGPHIFNTYEEALKTWRTWKRVANNEPLDSFWDMSKPIKFILGEKK